MEKLDSLSRRQKAAASPGKVPVEPVAAPPLPMVTCHWQGRMGNNRSTKLKCSSTIDCPCGLQWPNAIGIGNEMGMTLLLLIDRLKKPIVATLNDRSTSSLFEQR